MTHVVVRLRLNLINVKTYFIFHCVLIHKSLQLKTEVLGPSLTMANMSNKCHTKFELNQHYTVLRLLSLMFLSSAADSWIFLIFLPSLNSCHVSRIQQYPRLESCLNKQTHLHCLLPCSHPSSSAYSTSDNNTKRHEERGPEVDKQRMPSHVTTSWSDALRELAGRLGSTNTHSCTQRHAFSDRLLLVSDVVRRRIAFKCPVVNIYGAGSCGFWWTCPHFHMGLPGYTAGRTELC